MHWVYYLIRWLQDFALQVPLEVFVFVGSFIEEVVGPIPSTVVMTTAGVLAHVEDRTLLFVIWLALLGDLGKTIGAYIYYVIGDKLEDVIVGRFGRFFKLSHEEIEGMGKKLGQNHWKDGGTLFLSRLVPFFPTAPISIACGVIKMDKRIYLLATYLGNLGKDFLYLYSGYAGVKIFRHFVHDIERIRFGLGILIGMSVIVGLAFLYVHRHRGKRYLASFIEWLQNK
ncbi:MAG: VTT domain-containing protein [Candidatus Moraniibacteriota bacterium]